MDEINSTYTNNPTSTSTSTYPMKPNMCLVSISESKCKNSLSDGSDCSSETIVSARKHARGVYKERGGRRWREVGGDFTNVNIMKQ